MCLSFITDTGGGTGEWCGVSVDNFGAEKLSLWLDDFLVGENRVPDTELLLLRVRVICGGRPTSPSPGEGFRLALLVRDDMVAVLFSSSVSRASGSWRRQT